jgi:hypothetical protein
LQPGAGCRVSPSWLSFSDNQVIVFVKESLCILGVSAVSN